MLPVYIMSVETLAGAVRAEMAKAIAGQHAVVEQLLVAILADGHVLLEGVPGVAKTLMVRTLARTLDLSYGRIQFTPDLMPSDVIGTNVFDSKSGDFKLRKGPLFVNVLLADEINRTPPKTQAALLEAMEERKATIDGEPHQLPPPFAVFATQNPIDFEGTYPLPEAQQDRFLLKVIVEYPTPEAELEVLHRHHDGFKPQNLDQSGIKAVVGAEELAEMREEVRKTTVEEKIFAYILGIVDSTRRSHDLAVGASPRAGIALLNCSKAIARLRGRDFVIPDDVKELALPVLRHRVLMRPEAEIEGLTVDRVLTSLLDAQIVPR
ncbi:MAG: MoxR-like ATPase [Fimbriimonadaceae bacterium]|jgi:MoxR-like ATPase|nr:MoxR-like ATPase [Fimbriimonadaceae bacterium]